MVSQTTRTISLPGGSVTASVKNDIIRAHGIRYATAPRFQFPETIKEWEEPLDCTKPGPICPQNPCRLDAVTGTLTKGREMSEDCLRVKVTAPVKALQGGPDLPVMVWFHGGAYLSGGGDLDCYDPEDLARRNVVVVSVTYRLGIFGYLAVPDTAPANRGLCDQIAALKWVQTNIQGFGGDPHNVTIFGQSAGADSVFSLIVAEGTESLFHRAILQSFPGGVRTNRESMDHSLSLEAQEIFRDTSPSKASVDDLLHIERQLSTSAKRFKQGQMPMAPQLGHFPMPKTDRLDSAIAAAATRIEIFVGWTQDEGRPFVRMLDSWLPYFSIPFIGPYVEYACAWLFTRTAFMWPSQRLHNQVLQAGGQSTTFCFSWSPPEGPFGACHCIELPFLFGGWRTWNGAPMLYGTGSQTVIERVGPSIRDLWADFAKGVKLGPDHYNMTDQFKYTSMNN